MRVLADVDEADVGKLAERMEADVRRRRLPGRDRSTASCSRSATAPTRSRASSTYSAVVDVDNPDEKLRPGMTATVTIRTREVKGVPRVPNAALRYRADAARRTRTASRSLPPPEPPLAKGTGRVYVLTSDKPGDEKEESAS